MRHRRGTYRSATLRIAAQSWPFGAAAWEHETLRLLVQARWRPATDVAETTRVPAVRLSHTEAGGSGERCSRVGLQAGEAGGI